MKQDTLYLNFETIHPVKIAGMYNNIGYNTIRATLNMALNAIKFTEWTFNTLLNLLPENIKNKVLYAKGEIADFLILRGVNYVDPIIIYTDEYKIHKYENLKNFKVSIKIIVKYKDKKVFMRTQNKTENTKYLQGG